MYDMEKHTFVTLLQLRSIDKEDYCVQTWLRATLKAAFFHASISSGTWPTHAIVIVCCLNLLPK